MTYTSPLKTHILPMFGSLDSTPGEVFASSNLSLNVVHLMSRIIHKDSSKSKVSTFVLLAQSSLPTLVSGPSTVNTDTALLGTCVRSVIIPAAYDKTLPTNIIAAMITSEIVKSPK